ncbi:uncharacterized protein LOC100142049 [Tribolium castaneum]|uniref:uncharacterized protein LOC100142049 n=1 Tax=Tribolium castaneum TaxID=7070 RepID=UPI0001DCB711|nr:PREDICTED: uncharacterized protein LOC100142049 [Tribolium castaneum]|eukprot:XP_008200153.1 PREDICTED: uncharacterized protein LOC100142049 [Tribolium castaneum]
MNPTHYPPAITPGFMGVSPPHSSTYRDPNGSMSYFQNYRNEHLSRMHSLPYEWGDIHIEYTPKADIALLNKVNNLDKFIRMPQSRFTMLDVGRQKEIDDFYMACQLHRDQYKDQVGKLHPLDYFKTTDYTYQCAPDPTTKYLQSPRFYVKYKSPQVLPLSLERSYKSPLLPERALTGRYDPVSDIKYKR